MKLPDECRNLEDIRAELDRIDSLIITALGKRLDYVKGAAAFKADEKSIPAPDRVAVMLTQRRTWAQQAGLDPDFIEKTFSEVIAWFIEQQIFHFRSKALGTHGQTIDHGGLLQALNVGHERATLLARPVLVSLTQRIDRIDPVKLFDAARKCAGQSFLWAQGSPEFAIVSIDTAQALEAQGAQRFQQVLAGWRNLLDQALIDQPDNVPGVGPVLSGGFCFDPEQTRTPLWHDFADASLILPRLQLSNSMDASHLTLNVVIEAHQEPRLEAERLGQLWRNVLDQAKADAQAEAVAEPWRFQDVLPAEQWKQLVREVTATINTGSMQKVVLAREVQAQRSRPCAIRQSLERLRDMSPRAYLFAISRGEHCFFGATPERLVRLDAKQVEVTALAGTSRRGAIEAEDLALGEQLLASVKDRHEHALVVAMLRSTLDAFCKDLDIPSEPTLLKLKNVQHLYTPIAGNLRADTNLLDLVAALHPTPAVGGLPRAAALEYLHTHEQLDRGWFAAPVGWIDAQGDGEFAVALRSALVTGNHASLFAGCGIVGDSDPESEFAETALKLRAMMFALGQEDRQSR